MDKQKILNRVRNLKKLYEEGKVPQLHEHEVNPGLPLDSKENYIYFTLPAAINFQRSSPALWTAALKTYNDPKTNYLFDPASVVKTHREQIQKDMRKHNLALQRNKHPDIWIRISQTLHEDYNSDPRELFKEADYKISKILEIVQKEKKKQFPYLSGPKLSNYWLFMLNSFTNTPFLELDKISIIPDTHVIQCSIHLGLTKEIDKPEAVAQAWFDLLENTELIPIDMHSILWNWSRAGFKPEV